MTRPVEATPDKRSYNKAARRKTIESGRATGLLAYADGRVVGCCSVAQKERYANPRSLLLVGEEESGRVGSIVCFVVHGEYRKSGVAPRLLESACDLIRGWGLPTAEGYPRNPEAKPPVGYDIPGENLAFKGSLSMFLKNGFEVKNRFDRFVVVRKKV